MQDSHVSDKFASVSTLKVNTYAKIYTMAAAMLMAAFAAPAVAQTNDSETILDARLGEFIYHHDFYKDGKTDCYQLLVTDCEQGFNEDNSSIEGEGAMLSLFLCGPASQDELAPVLPAGEYSYSNSSDSFTFSGANCFILQAVDNDGTIERVKMPVTAGTVSITEETGLFTVSANLTVTAKDATSGEDVAREYKVTYYGPLLVPSLMPVTPGTVYELDIPSLEVAYDPAIDFILLSFYGYTKDEVMIYSEGDVAMLQIPYTGNDLIADLPGTYTHAPYDQKDKWVKGTFVDGYFYDLGMGYVIPMPSYVARYTEAMETMYCNLVRGGEMTITAIGDRPKAI